MNRRNGYVVSDSICFGDNCCSDWIVVCNWRTDSENFVCLLHWASNCCLHQSGGCDMLYYIDWDSGGAAVVSGGGICIASFSIGGICMHQDDLYKVGNSVKIKSGILKGKYVVIREVDNKNKRIKASIDVIGNNIVEIDFCQLDRL